MTIKKLAKEELENIARNLQKWAKKYDKYHVSVFVVSGAGHAFVDRNDKDYSDFDIYIPCEDDNND